MAEEAPTPTDPTTKKKGGKLRWEPLVRDYDKEDQQEEDKRPHKSATKAHPLLVADSAGGDGNNTNQDDAGEENGTGASGSPLSPKSNPLADDPLGDPLEVDPLGARGHLAKPQGFKQTAFTHSQLSGDHASKARRQLDSILDWEAVRKDILTTYTTQKNIPIVSKIVDDVEREPEVVTLTERAKRRLEGLEDEDDDAAPGSVRSFSQKELVQHLEALAEELEQAWAKGEKVKSLRIVIQSCKMLVNCKVPAVYPSLFVLVAKVLDTFGRLVFERIKRRAQVDEKTGKPIQILGEVFRPSDIPEEAKEMCKNWFFKIASIRELLPRVYVEMCLWNCNKFLSESRAVFDDMFVRFAGQIRGMGDPLVANYARLYLLRKATEVFPYDVPLTLTHGCLEDWLTTTKQWQAPNFQQYLDANGLSMADYVHLYGPAVRWELAMVGQQADEQLFVATMQRYEAECPHTMLLHNCIAAFRPALVSKYSERIVELIKASTPGVLKRYECYVPLGLQLQKDPPSLKKRLRILNEVWVDVAEIREPNEMPQYMAVAQVWLEFVVKHFKEREVCILLNDIWDHVGQKENFTEELENGVKALLNILLNNLQDFHELFALDKFLPMLDLLKIGSRVELCKAIMQNFAERGQTTGDPILINSLLDVARTLHDSLTDFSIEDERRQYGQLITVLMSRVDYGKNLEEHLNFFVECRRSFAKMDAITEATVLGAVQLVPRAVRTMTIKQHSKKGAAFVKACLAFCHITIPSLHDWFKRLKLLLLTAMVSLGAGFMSQCDVLMRTCINTLQDVPSFLTLQNNTVQATEESMLDFIQALLGAMVVIPGHPSDGPFYLYAPLIELVKEYQWEHNSIAKGRAFVQILQSLSAVYQDRLPYHFGSGTESNDQLYYGKKEYKTEIEEMCSDLLNEITIIIAELDGKNDAQSGNKMAQLSLELLNASLGFATPSDKMKQIIAKLYGIAKQHASRQTETFFKNTERALRQRELL